MTKTEMVKGTVGLVSTIGVAEIVGHAIVAVMPPNVKLLTKVCVWVGGAVVTAMASDVVTEYVEKTIDDITDWWKEIELEVALTMKK